MSGRWNCSIGLAGKPVLQNYLRGHCVFPGRITLPGGAGRARLPVAGLGLARRVAFLRLVHRQAISPLELPGEAARLHGHGLFFAVFGQWYAHDQRVRLPFFQELFNDLPSLPAGGAGQYLEWRCGAGDALTDRNAGPPQAVIKTKYRR